jgi:hypothetical protein
MNGANRRKARHISAWLNDAQHARLKDLAAVHGNNMNTAICRLIDASRCDPGDSGGQQRQRRVEEFHDGAAAQVA